MRDNSLICDLMFTNDNWKEIIESKRIRINVDNSYVIFNYDIDCDFSDPYVCEARGVIIDAIGCHVVCRGFDKFFNVQESYASEIDWNSAVIQEKIDGSIIKIWWSDRLDKWIESTNATIFAEDAPCMNSVYNFHDIIIRAKNYNNIMTILNSSDENKGKTWIFELVSPYNQVVINYGKTVLYHIGCRDNSNGKEYPISNMFDITPKVYPLKTLSDCLEAVKELNKSNVVTNEGFVVCDKYFNRVKIKSPEYLAAHVIANNHCYSKEKMIAFMLTNKDVDVLLDNYLFRLYKKYYSYQMELVSYELREFLDYCLVIDEEYGHDRKAVALAIKDNKYSGFGFEMLFKNQSKEDIINNLTEKDYCKYIPDFTKALKENKP